MTLTDAIKNAEEVLHFCKSKNFQCTCEVCDKLTFGDLSALVKAAKEVERYKSVIENAYHSGSKETYKILHQALAARHIEE